MKEKFLNKTGLELDVPSPGDIVTVLLRSNIDGRNNPHHYRHTTLWKVLSTNAGQALVKKLTGYDKDTRDPEIWAIKDHQWFDASEFWQVLQTEIQ